MKIKIVKNTIIFILKIILRGLYQSQLTSNVRWCIFVVVLICLFWLPIKPGQAQTIYVDVCAAGPGSGTEWDPFKLLSSAVATATPGSYIVMKSGLYPETMTISKSLTLTASDGIVRIGISSYGVGWQDVSLDIGSGISTNARVYYPSWTTGPNTQVASPCSGEQFPAIVYAHGLRSESQLLCSWSNDAPNTEISNDYLQAEGLLKRLVSSGIFAISFDWSSVFNGHYNETISPYIIDAIAYLGNKFGDSINLNRIGLIGHSTGGSAAINAAEMLRNNHNPPSVALGLIAPAQLLHEEHLRDPALVIHGTRDHACQVGTYPLEIYCKAEAPKHLVVITGANHFGYTDDICLDPNQVRESNCFHDPWDLFPEAIGWDNPCEVGGVSGQEAHKLQQRTAGNYLQAFFSYYLQDNADALDYLVQTKEEECGHPDLEVQCDFKELEVYLWWPKNYPETLAQHVQIEFRYLLPGDPDPVIVRPPPVDQNVNGGQWNFVATGSFPNEVHVRINSTGRGPVIADAVKFVAPGTLPLEEIVIDNNNVDRILDGGYWDESQEGSDWWGENYLITSQSGWYHFFSRYSTGFDVSGCEPVRYFDDLQALNVKVNVCSCLE